MLELDNFWTELQVLPSRPGNPWAGLVSIQLCCGPLIDRNVYPNIGLRIPGHGITVTQPSLPTALTDTALGIWAILSVWVECTSQTMYTFISEVITERLGNALSLNESSHMQNGTNGTTNLYK